MALCLVGQKNLSPLNEQLLILGDLRETQKPAEQHNTNLSSPYKNDVANILSIQPAIWSCLCQPEECMSPIFTVFYICFWSLKPPKGNIGLFYLVLVQHEVANSVCWPFGANRLMQSGFFLIRKQIPVAAGNMLMKNIYMKQNNYRSNNFDHVKRAHKNWAC